MSRYVSRFGNALVPTTAVVPADGAGLTPANVVNPPDVASSPSQPISTHVAAPPVNGRPTNPATNTREDTRHYGANRSRRRSRRRSRASSLCVLVFRCVRRIYAFLTLLSEVAPHIHKLRRSQTLRRSRRNRSPSRRHSRSRRNTDRDNARGS